jgi:hypothetical protein
LIGEGVLGGVGGLMDMDSWGDNSGKDGMAGVRGRVAWGRC